MKDKGQEVKFFDRLRMDVRKKRIEVAGHATIREHSLRGCKKEVGE